jgi:hypothetical protein
MRACFSVVANLAVAATLGAAALMAPPNDQTPTATGEVQLTAAPALGAIPAAFLRNQLEYCSVICTHALRGAVTIPVATTTTPLAFVGSFASTGSVLRAIGTAAASVTGPANAAATPIIVNDLDLVLPKAQHALSVTLIEALNVAAALRRPGDVSAAVQVARSRIRGALDEPMGAPSTPTGTQNILQVTTVESVNVSSAVVFQAGELALLGVVQTADATAQELARSGDPAAALAAGARQVGRTANEARTRVATAVDTATTNIRASLSDPFPSARSTQNNAETATETADSAQSSRRRDEQKSDLGADTESPAVSTQSSSRSVSSGSPSGSSASSDAPTESGCSSGCGSSDNATPSATKNTMNSGPPR